jgi:uncharacterized protein
VARILLDLAADASLTNSFGISPCMVGAYHGKAMTVSSLLGHAAFAATIDQRDHLGGTALWHACGEGHGAVVRALLAAGADPTISNHSGLTPQAFAERRGAQACLRHLNVSQASGGAFGCDQLSGNMVAFGE